MAEVSKELGVIAVLAKRMVEERLPKALALKDRVDKGAVLDDLDIAFLQQVVDDASKVKPLMKSDPSVLETCQNAAGSITVPEPLRAYMGGASVLKA